MTEKKRSIKDDFTMLTILLIPIGVAVNVVGGNLASLLKLPMYLDTIGTIFTGIIAGYFVEIIKSEAKDSTIKFLLDLERLPEMSKEELVELSKRAKQFLKEE